MIDNAVKYGSEKPIAVFVQTRHGSVIITVQDHGIGIPLERQEQIFQNRYRVHQLKRDGYGIGLSLVAPAATLAYSGGDFCLARPRAACPLLTGNMRTGLIGNDFLYGYCFFAIHLL